MPALFITGTDTDAGKTFASTILLHRLRADGWKAVGMKPVASGCVETPDGLRNADAWALLKASDPAPDYGLVNPFALRQPTAPEIAARLDGVTLELPPITDAFAKLEAMAEVVVVEGVGGFLAPISADIDQPSLPLTLQLPVVLVVGIKLGCINHARLTVEAIRARGLPLIGWIGSHVSPDMLHPQGYAEAVARALDDVPCLGVIPWSPEQRPEALVGHLRLPAGFRRPGQGG